MATFRNANLNLTTTAADVYTCPAATTAIIMAIQITSVNTTTDAVITVQWLDSSDTDKVTRLAFNYLLQAKLAFSPVVQGKLVLEAGDRLQALANAIDLAEITVSALELPA